MPTDINVFHFKQKEIWKLPSIHFPFSSITLPINWSKHSESWTSSQCKQHTPHGHQLAHHMHRRVVTGQECCALVRLCGKTHMAPADTLQALSSALLFQEHYMNKGNSSF